jgi:hypothetical protein
MGRILAVRKERQTTGASTEPATTPDGRVALRAPTSREGWRPRRPQEYRAQRTVPLPQGSHARDRVLAVRKERQTTGASAEPETTPDGWMPLRAPTGWEGRRPRRPQEYWAQRTAPLPQGPMGGTVSSRSGKMPGTGDCAPPARSHGRDRVLAVRKNTGHVGPCPCGAIVMLLSTVRNRPGRDGPHPGGRLEGAGNSLPAESRCTGHPTYSRGKRLWNTFPDTNRRHRTSAMLCALSFGRSPCPLCLCGLVLHAFVVGWQGRRFLWSQFFC